jgi:trans-aconitate methyltransferase
MSTSTNLSWSRYAKFYNNLLHLEAYKELLQEIIRNLEKVKHEDFNYILELGCGTGTLTRELSKSFPHAQITALENNDEMLKMATKLSEKFSNIEFHASDITDKENGFFQKYDLIVMNNVLYTIKEKQTLLKKIEKHLLPGGLLLISDPKTQTDTKDSEILKKQFKNLKSLSKLIFYMPSTIYITYFNKKIDKAYKRIDKTELHNLIKEIGLKIILEQEVYARQNNLVIARKYES